MPDVRAVPWPLADIVDFECLLARDEDGAAVPATVAALRERGVNDRAAIFSAWVENGRAQLGTPTPGRAVESGLRWAGLIAGAAGLVFGGGLCAGLLHYRGEQPVNVAVFLAATVGVQMVILFFALIFGLRSRGGGFEPVRAVWAAVARAFGAGLRHLPGEERAAAQATLSTLAHRHDLYGAVLTWPAVVAAQIFGVCWNTGLLAVLLAHVLATDLAFGWQSTLEASAEGAHRLVATVALPWSWLPAAHPDLAQVAATRFRFTEGIARLDARAAAAWWPFLAYAVACYGLLPRVALLAWARARERASRASLRFDHAACNDLFRRLLPPVVTSGAAGPELHVPAAEEKPTAHSSGAAWALVATEFSATDADISAQISRAFGWQTAALHRVEVDNPRGNQPVLDALRGAAGLAGVAVVVAAWRAPIVGMARTLAGIRAALPGGELTLLLAGRDGAAVAEEDFEHWRKFNAIHALGCGLAKWTP